MREFCAKAVTSQRSTDWATRILDRYADGEQLPDISLRMACEALAVSVDEIRAMRKADEATFRRGNRE